MLYGLAIKYLSWKLRKSSPSMELVINGDGCKHKFIVVQPKLKNRA